MYCSKRIRRALALAWLTVVVAACGGGGGGAAPTSKQPTADNVLSVTVESGPNGNAVNTLYAAVTICQPGSTTNCQTIDHVLVDTGSTGLRLLSSVVAPGLNLSRTTTSSGGTLLNCAQFLDNSFAWGPVVTVDMALGGKKAAAVPIQLIADPVSNHLAASCSSGVALSSVSTLGAKGILGIGLFKEDCGSPCASNAANGVYYSCSDGACSATLASAASTSQQLKNPVPLFASDNNGLLIDLPAVASSGAASLNGSVVFGIATQSNNQFTSGTVLKTSTGKFTAMFAGRSLNRSFLDTGSNALFFDSSAIPPCGVGASGFYCPSTRTQLSATLLDNNLASTGVTFSIDNALTLFSGGNSVLPTLSGPVGDAQTFDWGLPFFYGRRVFIGIEQQSSSAGTGPFYAF